MSEFNVRADLAAIADEIEGLILTHLDADSAECIDIRLQVYENGDWSLHTGDSQYDTDHTGYWGATIAGVDSDPADLAEDLVSEAEEDYYTNRPEPEKETPSPDDLFTSDGRMFFLNGRVVLHTTSGLSPEETWEALDDWMMRNRYYPDVWVNEERGGYSRMTRPEVSAE